MGSHDNEPESESAGRSSDGSIINIDVINLVLLKMASPNFPYLETVQATHEVKVAFFFAMGGTANLQDTAHTYSFNQPNHTFGFAGSVRIPPNNSFAHHTGDGRRKTGSGGIAIYYASTRSGAAERRIRRRGSLQDLPRRSF